MAADNLINSLTASLPGSVPGSSGVGSTTSRPLSADDSVAGGWFSALNQGQQLPIAWPSDIQISPDSSQVPMDDRVATILSHIGQA